MEAIAPWLVAGAGMGLTLALSRLTARVTTGLARVPMQFGLKLEPNYYGPRWVAIWLVPAFQLATVAFLLACVWLRLPMQGSLLGTNCVVAVACAVAQGLFYALLRRWRQRQG